MVGKRLLLSMSMPCSRVRGMDSREASMNDRNAQRPLTLFEGSEHIGKFSTEVELFTAAEAEDINSYMVIDSTGAVFKICLQDRPPTLFDKLADILGAGGAMVLVRKD
jgi:hypothetical protein